jgi:hypothetical protein
MNRKERSAAQPQSKPVSRKKAQKAQEMSFFCDVCASLRP